MNATRVFARSYLCPRRSMFTRSDLQWDSSIPIEEAFTPPSFWYTSKQFLEYEKQKVFHNNWLWVEDLKEPGSYLTGNYLGEPFIVTRDEDNVLHAFYNVCRHHGAQLLSDTKGSCKKITCPYHGWEYTLSGRLQQAKRVKGIKNFAAKDFGLRKIHLTQWEKWIFIAFEEPPESVNKTLSDLTELLKYYNNGVGLDKFELVATKEYAVNANWKVYIDNYCDGGYHVPVLHSGLNSQIDMRTYKTTLYPWFSLQQVSCNDDTAKNDEFVKSRIGNGGLYFFAYPNMMINRYGKWLELNICTPIEPDKTSVLFLWYYMKDEGEDIQASLERSLKISDQVQAEDAWISESVQKGLQSSGYDVGRYMPQVEQAAYHFHQQLYVQLTRE